MMIKTENKLYLYLYETGIYKSSDMIKRTIYLQDELSSRNDDGCILFITFGKSREEIMLEMTRITENELLKRNVSENLNLYRSKVDIVVVPIISDEVDLEYITRVIKSSISTNILGIVMDGLRDIHNIPTNPNYIENLKIIVHELNKFIDKYQIPIIVSRQIPSGGIDITKIHKDDAVIEMQYTLNFN